MHAQELLKKMTLEEKAAFCSGRDFWHTKAIERLGIPSVMMCDGPHGLRKQEGEGDHLGINVSIETVCYPTAAALASSFDRTVMTRLGEALGEECQAENVAMLLGPDLTSSEVLSAAGTLNIFPKILIWPARWEPLMSKRCSPKALLPAPNTLPATIKRHDGCPEVLKLTNGHCMKFICPLSNP